MDCIFCKIVTTEVPSEIVYETDSILAFLDAFPVTRGHTLLIPKKHYPSFTELPLMLAQDLTEILHLISPKIAESVAADGFNFGLNNGSAAGQVVRHVHWHIIPRFKDDGLKHWPNERVTPEKLSQVAQKIRSTLKSSS